jgi:hypothetical protein
MATRMQQRRGTVSQWINANPILNAGEIGWESDTNRFRIGDGVNHFVDLQRFYNGDDITASIDALVGIAPGTLDTLGELAAAIGNDPDFLDDYATITYVDGEITGVENQLADKADKTQYDAKGDLIVGASNNTPARLAVGTNGYLLTANSAATNGVEWAAAPVSLPSQTGNAGEFLTTDGNNASWAQIDLSAKQDVVSGVSSTEIGYLDGVTSAIQTQLNAKASDSALTSLSTTVDGKLSLTGGTLTGALTLSGAPESDLHAATKAYVDSATTGLNVHASVKAATTANITLATDVENGDTLDGVTLATGNRILVKNQTTKSENGVYVVKASGAPDRADDYNTAGEVDAGDFLYVEAGTANGKTGWIQTNVVATVGSSDIEFTQFSGAGTYTAGTGLTLTGSVFSINTGTTVDLSTAQSLSNKTIVAPRVQLSMKAETGTSYTLVVEDASNRWVTVSNSSAITVTVPPDVYSVGDQINVQQTGSGQITFAQGSGVTITSAAGSSSAPKIRSQYGSATVICVGSNSFTIVGDLI